MKTLISLVLALTTTAVLATENDQTTNSPAQSPDIARVVSTSPASTACDVVPATLVYIDHQGQTHELTYRVMGSCSGT